MTLDLSGACGEDSVVSRFRICLTDSCVAHWQRFFHLTQLHQSCQRDRLAFCQPQRIRRHCIHPGNGLVGLLCLCLSIPMTTLSLVSQTCIKASKHVAEPLLPSQGGEGDTQQLSLPLSYPTDLTFNPVSDLASPSGLPLGSHL